MKIIAYGVRPDELEAFALYQEELEIKITLVPGEFTEELASQAQGHDGISIVSLGPISNETLDLWASYGIKYLATRTIGYDIIDIRHAESLGIAVACSSYEPYGVADFTIMMILMGLRKIKAQAVRGQVNDYSLSGLAGRELRHLTVGILGAGRIGSTVAKQLQGFGVKIIANDLVENEELKDILTYVSKDRLFAESDVLTLHLPLNESTHHIINRRTLEKMSKGSLLVNCARGSLVDTEDLIRSLDQDHLGSYMADVIEGEEEVFRHDHHQVNMTHHDLAYLQQLKNVHISSHIAFYTEDAVRDMVKNSLNGLLVMSQGEDWQLRVI